MKKALIAVTALILFGGGFLVAQWRDTLASTQNEFLIPIHAQIGPLHGNSPIGEPCRISDHDLPSSVTPRQITITDELGSVVAMANLDGVFMEGGGGQPYCMVDLEVSVPKSSFFVVALGEQRIRGYADLDFPIQDVDTIWFDFGSGL